MSFSARFKFAALALAGLFQANVVLADDAVPLASYQQLLDRIERLEAQSVHQSPVLAGPAADHAAHATNPCCNPCCSGGWFVNLEAVIVKPFFTQNVAIPIADSLQTGEGGDMMEFDWELNFSPRVEFGYMPQPGGYGWRARWWHFQHDVVMVEQNVDAEFDFIDDPDVALSADDPLAKHAIQLRVWDIEALSNYRLFDSSFITSVGIRYTRLKQLGTFLDRDGTPDDSIKLRNLFEGMGPTASVTWARPVYSGAAGSLAFFGTLRGSLLFGRSGVRLEDDDGDLLIIDKNGDVMPVGELQVGFEYARPVRFGRFFVRSALETQYWVKAGSVSNAPATESDSADIDSALESDMGFLGFTTSIGFQW